MSVKPKLQISFRERDLGLGSILKEAAKLRKKPFVKAGVTQARGSKLRADGKKTVADIAQIHEYGAPDHGIPERSFIRSTRNRNEGKYKKLIGKLGEMIFDPESGITVEKALGIVGQQFTADVKNTIRNNEAGLQGPTPLKAATIFKKNAGKVAKAKSAIRGLEAKAATTGYRNAQKASGTIGPLPAGSFSAHLSDKDKGRLNAAAETVMTGGASTPLIDTAQMINSISYEVEINAGGGKE